MDSLHTCPIAEVARLGRTLRQWRSQILAYFSTGGVNNGGTEAINLLIEKTRGLAHGFRNFEHCRLRILLAADGSRPYRRREKRSTMRNPEEPPKAMVMTSSQCGSACGAPPPPLEPPALESP